MPEDFNSHSYLKPVIHVLHVEDNQSHAQFIHTVLENIPTHEFVISSAISLAEANVQMNRRKPDVILLDLTVKDSSGIVTVERMRDMAPLTPIVITTANDSQLLVQTAIRKGAQDYLFKNNINQDILNRTICNAIDRKIAANENHEKRLILETIMESSAISYWDWNIAKGVFYTSHGFKSMLGYSEEVLEEDPELIKGLIHEDDRERVQYNLDEHIKSKGRMPYEYIARYCHQNGSVIWVACKGKVIAWAKDGAPTRVTGCFINISVFDQYREMAF